MTVDAHNLLAIVLMGLATYGTRVAGLFLAGRLPRTGRVRVALDALPPDVLTAVIAPALVAGCAVVVKPSPYTPLTMLRIAELIGDGLPPGVLNVVSGGDELGPWLTARDDIDKISFTGSTATGKKVMATAANGLKRVTLELGGNDPAIVMPDVDIAEVAPKLFWGAFFNNAQLCLATKRMYIHKDIYEPLTKAIVEHRLQRPG